MTFADIALLTTAFSAVAALVSSVVLHGHVQSIHLQMNSRLDQLIDAVKQVERAAGVLEGKREQLAADALRRASSHDN